MVQTILISVSILIQIYILFILLRAKSHSSPDGEAEKKPRRFIAPSGLFAVESQKRSPKVNDDETLYERELER